MKPIVTLTAAALLFAGLVAPAPAEARCTCTCVNGREVALCDFPGQPAPPCGRPCRPAPASPPPVIRASPNPVGATACFPAQVQNPETGQWEWQEVCR
jgi:hypothetical protein